MGTGFRGLNPRFFLGESTPESQVHIQRKEKINNNKRAQRALGRSPEEKVKGQGEANYIIITKYW